jgi:acetyltransferase-like isoleucine patch superfamily enzyme
VHEFDYCPWLYWEKATDDDRSEQDAWQESLRDRGLREAGDRAFLSPLAAIFDVDLSIGADSYIAAHAYVTGRVRLGDHTTLNPYTVVRGTVTIGNGVRVGAHASVLGFNHTADPAQPVYQQPVHSKGIVVGDDVWIGSNAIILDGVTVGGHSIIGAGAVVTKDVPPWSVMGGNPARRLRDRRDRKPSNGLSARLTTFARQARDQVPALLDRYRAADGWFVNQPGSSAAVRPTCDAVEIADLLLGGPPPRHAAPALIERLATLQDPVTGLIPELGETDATVHSGSAYHLLSVGYALDLLSAALPHPIAAIRQIDDAQLLTVLDGLPWETHAWGAGAWVDMYATALHWNRRLFALDGPLETLLGWLLTRQDPWSGLWGSPTVDGGRRQPVNGYYRLTRGSFGQFGLPVPRPEATVDSVLAHTRDDRWFANGRGTACDVLDVIHPLWLCGSQTGYRRNDGQNWARARLDDALTRWQTDAGFAFSPVPITGSEHEPSLMGTEMWLSIIWLLADVLGESGALGYRPRGVHRPEPAVTRQA